MTKPILHIVQKDSPIAFLTAGINDSSTILILDNSRIFLDDNITRLTLGITSEITETIDIVSYDNDNQITVIRGTPAYNWPINTPVARVLTKQDITEIHSYLNYLDSEITGIITDELITNGDGHNHITGGSEIPTNGIQNEAITNSKLASNSVNGTKFLNNAVTNEKISDGAIKTNNFSNASITSDKIVSNAISSTKIAADAVIYNKRLIPFCFVYRYSSMSISANVYTLVTYNGGEVSGPGSGMWNSSYPNRITFPIPGWYFINFKGYFGSGDYQMVCIEKNNSGIFGLTTGPTNSLPYSDKIYPGFSGSQLAYMEENSYIQMYVKANTKRTINDNIYMSAAFIMP